MYIQSEHTPNPLTLKFFPGRVVMKNGTAFFQNKSECSGSLLATRLFSLEGVTGVFFGSDFITVTKKENFDWLVLKPIIVEALMDHYNSNQEVLNENQKDSKTYNSKFTESKEGDSETVKQIKELLDTRIRPAVAVDGGDIIFKKYEERTVFPHMQGACSGCPSSTATLRMGIENMLKHYIPEIKEIKQIGSLN